MLSSKLDNDIYLYFYEILYKEMMIQRNINDTFAHRDNQTSLKSSV